MECVKQSFLNRFPHPLLHFFLALNKIISYTSPFVCFEQCSLKKGTSMNKSYKKTSAIRMALIVVMAIGLFSTTAVYAKWSFGVIADNQDATGCPHGLVATQTIHQIDAQFIAKGAKLVVQVGDELNSPSCSPTVHGDLIYAAQEAQNLYNVGIGFFPLRGNHEAQSDAGKSDFTINMFRTDFPQTSFDFNSFFFGATHFNSPTLAGNFPDDLKGLSYSFDYFGDGASARFLILDDWGTDSVSPKHRYNTRLGASYPLGYSMREQQEWISGRLDKNTRGTNHAFVFAHHNLIGEDHVDCLFGNPNDDLNAQDTFLASLARNDVKYFTSGHEHVYNRSFFSNTTGSIHVQDNMCAPAGPKFLQPIKTMSSFFGQKTRQTQLSQEMYNVGFCIYTIDGPRVTVDYYSDATGGYKVAWPDGLTPTFTFVKKESWGYSLNGQEFLIAQGASYTGILDNFGTTTARILNGQNGNTAKDYEGRPLTKCVNTGWTEKSGAFKSDILTIWGMANFGTPEVTDQFAISMTYDPTTVGPCALMSQKSDGTWANAVDLNTGNSNKKFVIGPYKSTFGLGAYGIDPATKTVWAVINHSSDFAAQRSLDGDLNNDGVIDNRDVAIVTALRNQPASANPAADLDNDGIITLADARKLVLIRTN